MKSPLLSCLAVVILVGLVGYLVRVGPELVKTAAQRETCWLPAPLILLLRMSMLARLVPNDSRLPEPTVTSPARTAVQLAG